MGRLPVDRTGKRYGKWVALSLVPGKRGRGGIGAVWLSRCDCGTLEERASQDLQRARETGGGCKGCGVPGPRPRLYEVGGERLTARQLAARAGLSYDEACRRLRRGLTAAEVLAGGSLGQGSRAFSREPAR